MTGPTGTPKLGMQIGLYLDEQGMLVISDRKREDLLPLRQSQGFTLRAPLDDVVTANVQIIVGSVELAIPLDQARFIVADEEVTGAALPGIKKAIEAVRAIPRKAENLDQPSAAEGG